MIILTCPKCQTKYQLSEDKLKPKGRKVRCSKCRYIFWAYSDGHVAEVSASENSESKKENSDPEKDQQKKEPIFDWGEDQGSELMQADLNKHRSGLRIVWIVLLILVIIGAGIYFGYNAGLFF